MAVNPYELRFQITKRASKYHMDKYGFEKSAFDAGLIDQEPEFPTEKAIRETADFMKWFVDGKS